MLWLYITLSLPSIASLVTCRDAMIAAHFRPHLVGHILAHCGLLSCELCGATGHNQACKFVRHEDIRPTSTN